MSWRGCGAPQALAPAPAPARAEPPAPPPARRSMLTLLQMGLRAFMLFASKIWGFFCYMFKKQCRAVSIRVCLIYLYVTASDVVSYFPPPAPPRADITSKCRVFRRYAITGQLSSVASCRTILFSFWRGNASRFCGALSLSLLIFFDIVNIRLVQFFCMDGAFVWGEGFAKTRRCCLFHGRLDYRCEIMFIS